MNRDKSIGYLECMMDYATYCIVKNIKTSDKEKYTLDPVIQISGLEVFHHIKVSAILESLNIAHSRKRYNTPSGQYCRIVITSIYNIKSLLDMFDDVVFESDKMKKFVQFINLRYEKLLLNKKARYGDLELEIYGALRVLHSTPSIVTTDRVL